MKYYTIIENTVPIGFFTEQIDRDNAFKEYIEKNKERYGMKGQVIL